MGIGHGVPLGNGPQLQQGLVGAEIMILTMGEAMVCAVKTYHYYGMVKINRGNMGKLYQKKKSGHFWGISGPSPAWKRSMERGLGGIGTLWALWALCPQACWTTLRLPDCTKKPTHTKSICEEWDHKAATSLDMFCRSKTTHELLQSPDFFAQKSTQSLPGVVQGLTLGGSAPSKDLKISALKISIHCCVLLISAFGQDFLGAWGPGEDNCRGHCRPLPSHRLSWWSCVVLCSRLCDMTARSIVLSWPPHIEGYGTAKPQGLLLASTPVLRTQTSLSMSQSLG